MPPAVSLPVIVAAAGLGSRLGLNRPKALVEVGGRSILQRLLTGALRHAVDVRIVVGFRETEVMAHAQTARDDLIFVRNPAFGSTTVAHSFALALADIAGPCLIVDGDMLVDERSFARFAALCADGQPRIGIAPAASEQAVFVETASAGEGLMVTGFRRAPRATLEWCGIACVDRSMIVSSQTFVFESLAAHLPLLAVVLDVAEVDTQDDLARAQHWATIHETGFQDAGVHGTDSRSYTSAP
jgi:choline kinase